MNLTANKQNKILITIIVSLLIFDLLSKFIVSNLFEINKETVIISKELSCYPIYNKSFTNEFTRTKFLKKQISKSGPINYKIKNSLSLMAIILIILLFRKLNILLINKLIFGFILYLVLIFAINSINFSKLSLFHFIFPNIYSTEVFSRTIGFLLLISLYFIIKSFEFRIVISLFIAASLGNLVSLLIPPFRVLDFIYIHRIYNNLPTSGIMNIADILFYLAYLLLFILFILKFIRLLQKKIKKQENTA